MYLRVKTEVTFYFSRGVKLGLTGSKKGVNHKPEKAISFFCT